MTKKWKFHDNNVLLSKREPKSIIDMRVSVLFLTLLLSLGLVAQSVYDADVLFKKRDYSEAAVAYESLLKKYPQDPLYNYRYALCAYELREYDKSIAHFRASGNKYPLRDYYLADAYYRSYRFDEAQQFFSSYSQRARRTGVYMTDVEEKIKKIETARQMLEKIQDIEIIDTISCAKEDFIKFFRLSRETGKISHQLIDLHRLGITDLMSFINADADRRIYSDTLKGNLELFSSEKTQTHWTEGALLQTEVNTEFNENYPFLTSDGKTLYFASDNPNSIGGYDIFMSRYSWGGNGFVTPENIGMPFNSIYNDYMLVIDEVDRSGWFVSDRLQPIGRVMVYNFRLPVTKKIIHSGSHEQLVDAALLKTHRKAGLYIAELQSTEVKPAEQPVARREVRQINFVLNDEISYTNTGQFRSPKAIDLWSEWEQIHDELLMNEDRLLQMRREYGESSTAAERSRLAAEITALESAVIRLRVTQDDKLKSVRNEELNYLKNVRQP